MNKAKDEDEYGIIEMHNYLTSAYGDDDPKSFVLKTFQELNFKKEGVDFISNTKVNFDRLIPCDPFSLTDDFCPFINLMFIFTLF